VPECGAIYTAQHHTPVLREIPEHSARVWCYLHSATPHSGAQKGCLSMVSECGAIYTAQHHTPVLREIPEHSARVWCYLHSATPHRDAWAWWPSEVQCIARCQWWHSVVPCTVRHQCVVPDTDTRASCRSVAPDCGPCVCKSRLNLGSD